MPSTQSERHTLGLAGEFYVAAELLRRGLLASVTYGNAKKADVVAVSPTGTSAAVLEVKSTSQASWIVGNAVPAESDRLWVFVYVPPTKIEHPRFFILTSTELHDILAPEYKSYQQRFRTRNGRDFTGTPVITLTRRRAEPFEGKWEKVVSRIHVA